MPKKDGFIDKTAGFFDHLEAAGNRAIERIALAIEANYKENLRDTLNTTGQAKGYLLSGAAHETEKKGLESSATIGNRVIYARIHEFGGVIEPKNAPFLVFRTADGEWHSVSSVTIPARPTLRPAMLDHIDDPEKILAEELDR